MRDILQKDKDNDKIWGKYSTHFHNKKITLGYNLSPNNKLNIFTKLPNATMMQLNPLLESLEQKTLRAQQISTSRDTGIPKMYSLH